MTRTNGHLGPAAVTVKPVTYPTNNGTAGIAIEGQDFAFDPGDLRHSDLAGQSAILAAGLITWHLGDGTFGQNNGYGPSVDPNSDCEHPAERCVLQPDRQHECDRQPAVDPGVGQPHRQRPVPAGGREDPAGRGAGPASRADDHRGPAYAAWSPGVQFPHLYRSETTNAIITVTRTNGVTGMVTVEFQTLDGTATNLIHYRTNWTRVTFNGGDTVKTVVVTNINEKIQEGDHTVNLRLYNPSGGATLGLSNAVLTLIDNDITGGYVQFNSPTYLTNENAGIALVTVTRNGSSAGTLGVEFSTRTAPPPTG